MTALSLTLTLDLWTAKDEQKQKQGALTKPALGTFLSPMPNPHSTDTVCQPIAITTLKLISCNTVLLIQNLILNSLVK